ncbi:Cerato-platanin [Arthrobotrys entomopaga]|nr:Cerato-platanin [Arthrobotrys entomopaga]
MLRFLNYLFFLVTAVAATTFKYDNIYSTKAKTALTSYACSDGNHGLIDRHKVHTVPQLLSKLRPGVMIAAAPAVTGWNSPGCGTCWMAKNPKNNKSITFVAVDVGRGGIVVGPEAFVSVSASRSLKEGSFVTYLYPKPASACFK